MRKPGESLGREIRRLRTTAGITLRKFADQMQICAPYLSDIEHDRRRPSMTVLLKIADALRPWGATFESLDRLSTRLERDIQDWISENPAVRQILRHIFRSEQNPRYVLRKIEGFLDIPTEVERP